jgi:hypothetical protein
MKRYLLLFCLSITALSISGCVYRIADLTLVSTRNVDISRFNSAVKVKDRVIGEDKKLLIVAFPTGAPNLKEAIDRAIQSYPECVALSDAVLYERFFYIPYIYGEFGYKVEGHPILLKSK